MSKCRRPTATGPGMQGCLDDWSVGWLAAWLLVCLVAWLVDCCVCWVSGWHQTSPKSIKMGSKILPKSIKLGVKIF